jgi:hypothetical protein
MLANKNCLKRLLLGVSIIVFTWGSASPARAFCGFFVAKADASLHNASSKVIIAREGNRNIFFMANDYQGEVKDFARIVPIPVVPKQEQVRIGNNELIAQLDAFTAPRLVQYEDNLNALWWATIQVYVWMGGGLLLVGILIWALITAKANILRAFVVLFCIGVVVAIALPSFLSQANKAGSVSDSALNVTVEDQFSVGEYDVTFLSAEQSEDLITWLTQNGYNVPTNARSMLQDYLEQGMKFFVVRVNLEVFEKEGYGFLRPIVLDYESPKFMLPIRLGTLNATGDQDLSIFILSPSNYAEVANYRTVFMPTDAQSSRQEPSGQELPPFVENEFGKFYEAMFQREYEREGKNVAFLEYAGSLRKCDPCAVPFEEIMKLQNSLVAEGLGNFLTITRLHVRYSQEKFPEDLVFQEVSPDELQGKVTHTGQYFSNRVGVTFQARYVIRRPKGRAFFLAQWHYGRWNRRWENNLANLTGWEMEEIRKKSGIRNQESGVGSQ